MGLALSRVVTSEVGLYLVSLLTPRDGAGKRLLLAPVHAHGAEDGFRADGALRGPGLVAVRLLVVRLLLVVLTACRVTGGPGRQEQSPPLGALCHPEDRRSQWQPRAGTGSSCPREGIPGTHGLQTHLVPRTGLVGTHLHSPRGQGKDSPTIHVQELAEQEPGLSPVAGQAGTTGAGKPGGPNQNRSMRTDSNPPHTHTHAHAMPDTLTDRILPPWFCFVGLVNARICERGYLLRLLGISPSVGMHFRSFSL